jgi:hypothetical protein
LRCLGKQLDDWENQGLIYSKHSFVSLSQHPYQSAAHVDSYSVQKRSTKLINY